MLGTTEYDRGARMTVQQPAQRLQLVLARDAQHPMLQRWAALGLQANLDGIMRVLLSHVADPAGHGRGGKNRLWLVRETEQLLDRRRESGIEHLVRLVEHQVLDADSDTLPWPTRSRIRPGVPTTIDAGLQEGRCVAYSDTAVEHAERRSQRIERSTFSTWSASSRVGVTIRAFGPAPRLGSRSIIGMRKASVFPDPVGASMTTSRPCMSAGIASAWT